jgi:hypothetical protein
MPVEVCSAHAETELSEDDFQIVLLFSLSGLTLSLYLFPLLAVEASTLLACAG